MRSTLIVAAALAIACGSKKEDRGPPPAPVAVAASFDAAPPADAEPTRGARVSPTDLREWPAKPPVDPDKAYTLLAVNAHPADLAYLLRDPHAPYLALRAAAPALTGRGTAATPSEIWTAIAAAHPEATAFPRVTRTKASGRAPRMDMYWRDIALRDAVALLAGIMERRVVVTSARDLRVDLAVRRVHADAIADALLEVAGLERHRVGGIEHWVDAGAGPPAPPAAEPHDAGATDAGAIDASPPPLGDPFDTLDAATARLSATLIGPRRAHAVISSPGHPSYHIEARGTGEADRIEIVATFA
ncbi:MAG TPA: hypothetical protein VML75_24235, partial [Kofleriaceae bacterium]|nr:hypothetical protein [Kofleriaceae bacterium]